MLGFEDSFDGNAAGGWGESFASSQQQNAPDSHMADKVPLPSTVAELSALNDGSERITIGSNSFTTIHVVGQVKKSVALDGEQSIEYTLSDFRDHSREFLVIHYKGVANGANTSDVVVEGTDVSIVGKLRSFNNRMCIVAFDVREIENKKEIDVFHLEVKLARLYYSKNIPDVAISGNLSGFKSTMLRGADTGSPETTTKNLLPILSTTKSDDPRKLYHDCRGLIGQQAEIFRYLRDNGHPTEGLHIDEVRRGLPRHVYNERTFLDDIYNLSNEGLIYSTADDERYAANA